MATYTFDDLVLPSGTVTFRFRNDNGDASSYNVNGNYFLSIATIEEAVEENGIGGVPRIPELQIRVYDRAGKFHDEIFDRATVTQCDCLMKINIGGTDYPVIFGSVRLSPVEYETFYDNEGGTEAHYCTFTVFGLLDKLSAQIPSALRTYLDTVDTSGSDTTETTFPFGGFTRPTVFTNDATIGTEDWLNPYWGGFPDGAVASVGLNGTFANKISKYLKLTNFIQYPSGDQFIDSDHLGWTVDGIEVDVKRYSSSTKCNDNSVKLVKGGVISGTDRGGSSGGSAPWSTTPETATYGTPTDLWGTTWTPSDFNGSGFGVVFSAYTITPDIDTAHIDSVRVRVYLSNPGGGGTWVKVLDIFDSAATLMADYLTIDATTHNVPDTYTGKRTSPTTVNFGDLYVVYTANDGSYYGLFADGETDSWMSLSDLRSVLESLATSFLCYMLVNYDLSNDHVSIELRRREGGTATLSENVGLLKRSIESSFVGYDAVRTYQLGEVEVNGVLGQVATPTAAQLQMTSEQFNEIVQRFDFATGIIMTFPGYPYLLSAGTFYTINIVTVDAVAYTDYELMLNTKFIGYWTSPVTLTRTYGQTVGIGGTYPIKLLDQITVDGNDYAVISIRRDFLANEMTVKMVKF